jgi:hypothetical protein
MRVRLLFVEQFSWRPVREIPNSNTQHPEKFQEPNNQMKSNQRWCLGAWNLNIIWRLEFGIQRFVFNV